jgi:predicted dehydrogenase
MNVVIVGCGRAGGQHTAAIVAAGARVAAVCDEDPRAAARLGSIASAPTRPLRSILDDPAIDTIAICTPPDSHVSLALESLKARKAVIVEKPVAPSRSGVEQLASAARASARPLAVMLQHRGRLPPAALEREWSAASSGVVEVFRERSAVHYTEGSWRGDGMRAGGGFLAHLGIHYADLACQLLGSPSEVQMLVDTDARGGIDVRVAVCARMDSGALLTLQASSLPLARAERLHVLDGDHELVLTNTETRYRQGNRDQTWPAPSTPDLRADVYREVRRALLEGRAVETYGPDTAVAATCLLEQVRAAVTTATR